MSYPAITCAEGLGIRAQVSSDLFVVYSLPSLSYTLAGPGPQGGTSPFSKIPQTSTFGLSFQEASSRPIPVMKEPST